MSDIRIIAKLKLDRDDEIVLYKMGADIHEPLVSIVDRIEIEESFRVLAIEILADEDDAMSIERLKEMIIESKAKLGDEMSEIEKDKGSLKCRANLARYSNKQGKYAALASVLKMIEDEL